MASTKELRTRNKSISNTAKVTGAMQMIAASKLRKAQNSAEEFNLFSKGYDDIKNSLMGSVNFDLLSEISPLFNNEDSEDSTDQEFTSFEPSEKSEEEDDLEIPAFLRRQKN